MLLTVAVCTWNRASLLRQTLEYMTRLIPPSGATWELVIVDNNSDDSTDAVIGEFVTRLPVRSVWEGAAGLSNARNTAVAAAHGDYIVWTDDDVLVAPNWLSAYASAFERYPNAVVFGGPIKPWFTDEPPLWLTQTVHEVEPAYAIRDFNCGDVSLSKDIMPFGANMAFRTTELRDHPFNPSLGRTRTEMLGGEEEMVIRTLLDAGLDGRWVPDAGVRHYIPPERQTVQYLRRFYQGVGATKARMDQHVGGRMLLGRPSWVWSELITTELLYRLRRSCAPAPEWVRSLRRASMARGRFTVRVSR